MSGRGEQRVGRFYTAARRHPWVLGKIGDFRLWLGPYNAVQIAVAVLGALVLINTVAWWSPLGPVPLVAWVLVIWAVRHPKIAGRSPLAAVSGWLMLLSKPAAGRIGGRPARDKQAQALVGGFVIEGLARHRPAGGRPSRRSRGAGVAAPGHSAQRRRPRGAVPAGPMSRSGNRGRRRRGPSTSSAAAPVASSVQLLLARTAMQKETL